MSRILSVAPLRARTETRLQSAYGTIEVLDISWPAPVDLTVIESSPVLECSLRPSQRDYPRARFCVDGASNRFNRLGTAMFKPPGVPLHVLALGGESYTVRCVFSGEHFEELRQRAGDWAPDALNDCLDIQDKSIRALLLRLMHEARTPGFASELLVAAGCTTLLVELLRHLRGKRDTPNRATGGLSPRQLRRVQDFIADAEKAVSVAELAAVAGLSTRHLTRAFKQSTGITVGAYVEEVQLDKAKRWLAESDLAIKQIAARLGFAHAKNFSSAFYRATRQSPLTFRHEHRRHT